MEEAQGVADEVTEEASQTSLIVEFLFYLLKLDRRFPISCILLAGPVWARQITFKRMQQT